MISPASLTPPPHHNVTPVDLKPRPDVPATPLEEVAAIVQRARAAQPEWERLGFERRAKLLTAACKRMLERRQEAVDLLLEEGGKYPPDALMNEAIGPLEFLSQWVKTARPHLKPRRLPIPRLAFPGKRAVTELVPRGVVGIIAPWNYPVATYFKPVFPALLSGNAIVVKPSEFAPRSGAWFQSILAEFLPPHVYGLVQGSRDVGQALVRGGIDSLTFTGSVPSGKAVLKLCAEQMIPCSVELGGKDPAIVLPDCDLERTVAGVLNWGMHNAGQDCGAIERVYVLNEIADRFVPMLAKAVAKLRVGRPGQDNSHVDVGPLNNPRQLEIVDAHVKDAVEKGAVVLCGGKRTGQGLWFEPTVLDQCNQRMKTVSDETFGPVLPILRVKDIDEAVRMANDSSYGLNASVWGGDLARAEAVARRLQAGTVFVNNHALTGAMPFAPWTGVKESGYGVANSVFALANYVRPRTVFVDHNKKPDPWWFPKDDVMRDIGERLARAQLGNYGAALKVPGLIKARIRTVLGLVRSG